MAHRRIGIAAHSCAPYCNEYCILHSKVLRLAPWEPPAVPRNLHGVALLASFAITGMSFCALQFHTYFHCVRELHPSLLSSEISSNVSSYAQKHPSGSRLSVVYEWLLVPKAGPFSLDDSYTPFSICCALQYLNHLQGSNPTNDQRRPCQDSVLGSRRTSLIHTDLTRRWCLLHR